MLSFNPDDNQMIEVVYLVDINDDPAYSRCLNDARVIRMATDYQPHRIGIPQLSRRANGTYWRLDGGHRIKASMLKGIKAMKCAVIYNLTLEQEADLFYRLNKERGNLTPFDLHKARVAACDVEALDIDRIVREAGFILKHGGKTPGQISAVRGIENCYRWYGPEELRLTLRLIAKAYDKNIEATQAWVTDGMGRFFSAYRTDPKLDFQRLVSQTSQVAIETFKLRSSAGKTRMSPLVTATEFLNQYNLRLHKKKNKLDVVRLLSSVR